MIPGEIICPEGAPDIELNVGLATLSLVVSNCGDRPVQVGSHFHFAEVNSELSFDRDAALGYRLNIPAGTAIRFEPGDTREIPLVAFAGAREIHGFNGHVERKNRMKQSRKNYAGTFGPTVGDRVRLADTELFIEVERDLVTEGGGYGNEVKFGGGKVIRDGMAQAPLALDADSLDLVITNALILDSAHGVIKADIGIKGGRIVGVGHAGNPLLQDGISMTIGAATEVIAGEGCIVTAGGIDTHIHFICPQQIEHAMASGITTMLGGGAGPAHGTYATTCTPGKWNIHRMLE